MRLLSIMCHMAEQTGIPSVPNSFGQWLAAYRHKHRLTQWRVGEWLGVRQSNVARIETGERQIDYDLVVTLHSIFALKYHDVDLDEMLVKAHLQPVGGSAPGGALQLSLTDTTPDQGEDETRYADDRQQVEAELHDLVRNGQLTAQQRKTILRALILLNDQLENPSTDQPRDPERGNMQSVAARA